MIGSIRQEILSGVSDKARFEELKTRLSVLKDVEIITEDYEEAARFYNECRKHGIQGSHIDYLICSIAARNNFTIFTLDKDFIGYKKHLPVRLYGESPT